VFGVFGDLLSAKFVAIFFALISGISAVSAAALPSVLNI